MSDLEDKIAQIMGGNFSPNPSPVVGFRKVGATLSKFDSASDASVRKEAASIPSPLSTPQLASVGSDRPALNRNSQSDPALDRRDQKSPPPVTASPSAQSSRTTSPVNFERGSGPKVITRKSIAGRTGSTPDTSPRVDGVKVTPPPSKQASSGVGIAEKSRFSFETDISPIRGMDINDKDPGGRSNGDEESASQAPSGVNVDTLLFGAASPDESVDPLAETVKTQVPVSSAVTGGLSNGSEGAAQRVRASSLPVRPNTEPRLVSAASSAASPAASETAETESSEAKLLKLMGKLRDSSQSGADLLNKGAESESALATEVPLLELSPGDLPKGKNSRRASQAITVGPKPSDIKRSGSFIAQSIEEVVKEDTPDPEQRRQQQRQQQPQKEAVKPTRKGFGSFAAEAAASDVVVPKSDSAATTAPPLLPPPSPPAPAAAAATATPGSPAAILRRTSSPATTPRKGSEGKNNMPSVAFKSTAQIPSAYSEPSPKAKPAKDSAASERSSQKSQRAVETSQFATPSKANNRPVGGGVKPVKVAVRVRPFSSFERQAGARRTISKHNDNLIIVNPKAFEAEPDTIAAAAVAMDNKQWAQIFRFDHCLWSYDPTYDVEKFEDQIGVHKAIGLDMVENAMNGVSTSCFAYGHTSTGKTYSLFGPPLPKAADSSGGRSLQEAKMQLQIKQQLESIGNITAQSGLIQRVFHDVIRLTGLRDSQLHRSQPTRFFISFLEIYNDKIRDLLAVSVDDELMHAMSTPASSSAVESLKVREHPVYGPYVDGLKKIEVTTPEEALVILQEGQKNRTTAQTAWNALSSRSHAVVSLELSPTVFDPHTHFVHPAKKELFQQRLNSSDVTAADQDNSKDCQPSLVRVQMIDLAGSEKDAMREQDEDSGVWTAAKVNPNPASTPAGKSYESFAEKEKNELRMIRRSLSTLGFIIKALVKGASLRSLPYRDCVLTFLLRDALNGSHHTTMLSTISPAHTCYDETLSTLRYAERLCKMRPQQSAIGTPMLAASKSGGRGSRGSSPARLANDRITAVVGGDSDMKVSRNVLLEEFEKIHEGLGKNKPGTEASRRLLKETISDPQQRIARMTKVVYNTVNKSVSTPTAARSRRMTQLQNGQYINPMDGSMKPLSELTDADLEDLKNSYRTLTSELIELQIDLDSVRTDRDSMMVELKGAQDMLSSVEQARADAHAKSQQLGKSVKAAEKELDDLHVLLRRKEETVDRLLVELGEEKQARLNAEQAYHSRTKEFLSRFEAIKKENKALSNSVDSLTEKYQAFGEEKKNLRGQLDKQKESIRSLTAAKEASELQVKRLQEESEERMKLFEQLNERAQRVADLDQQSHADKLQIERLTADVAMLTNERDSLMAMVAQKDSLMQIQSQQAEMSIKMLQQRQAALEQADGSTHPAAAQLVEFNKLQMSLSSIFLSEEAAMRNEVMDVHMLISKVRDLQQVLDAARLLERQLDSEKRARFAAEQMLEDVKSKATTGAKNEVQLKAKIAQLKKELKSTPSSETGSGLQSEVEHLRAENAQLREQLQSTASIGQHLQQMQHPTAADQSKLANQGEFNSLWQAVQELNKLDALKDKLIQSLREEKDKITSERDLAAEKLQSLTSQYNELREELQEIDRDLIFAVQNGGFHPSASGGNHSIVLSHVTDRMMQGLAKRHEAGARPPPPIDSTPLRSGNYQRNTGHQLDHSSVSSYGPGSAQSSRASTPAVATPAGSGMYGNALAGGVAGDRWMSQPLASQTPSSRLRGHENPPPSAQSGALSSVPYGASPYNNYLQQSQPPQYSATPYSIYPPQQQQSMPQQQHTPGNYSQMPPRSGHAQPLRIDAGGAYSDEDEEEKGNALSEEILERQIEELSDFLVDESKLKRMRQRTNNGKDLMATKKKVYTPKTKLSFEY